MAASTRAAKLAGPAGRPITTPRACLPDLRVAAARSQSLHMSAMVSEVLTSARLYKRVRLPPRFQWGMYNISAGAAAILVYRLLRHDPHFYTNRLRSPGNTASMACCIQPLVAGQAAGALHLSPRQKSPVAPSRPCGHRSRGRTAHTCRGHWKEASKQPLEASIAGIAAHQFHSCGWAPARPEESLSEERGVC